MMPRPRWPGWVSEALVVTMVVLLPLLFWWRLWTPDLADRATLPEGDFTSQYYPLQFFAARELAAGRLPAWDPYLNAGQPGLADIQTGTFYPLNLLPGVCLALWRLPLTLGLLTAQVILHHSLAGLFTYLFARHLARRAGARVAAARFAGAVAALCFTYSGYLTSFPVQQLTILETAVWLPLVLLFLDRSYPHTLDGVMVGTESDSRAQRNRGSQVLFAGMAMACGLLAGHPQTALYLVYATAAYGLFKALGQRPYPPGRGLTSFVRNLLPLAFTVLLGVALAAIQLIPTLGFVSRSTRAGLNYDTVSWGLPLAEVTHLLYPGYFGGSPQYVGIVAPILVAAALLVKRARRQVVFWFVIGLVAFVLAFGGNSFLYSVFYLVVPGFGAVRNQERVIYLFSFAVSVLAGYGSLTLVQPLSRQVRIRFARLGRGVGWIFAVFAGLTALYYFGYLLGVQQSAQLNMFEGVLRHHTLLLLILGTSVVILWQRRAGRVRRGCLIALTLSAIWLNLFTVNWRFNLAQPAAAGVFPESHLVRFLQGEDGTFRVSSAGLLPGGASAGIVYQLEDITANTPLRLQDFQKFEDGVEDWRRWQLLNVRYILDSRDLDGPGLERVYQEGEIKVYRITDPLPRAWMVRDVEVAVGDQALDRLSASEFDPRTMAIVSPGGGLSTLSPSQSAVGASVQSPLQGGDQVAVVERAPGRLTLDVSAEDRGLLVISQPFYPGWRAWVDGSSVPIYRVNYLLQGTPVEAGNHRVELRYHLSPLPAVLTLVTLAAALSILVTGALKRRR